MGKLLYGFGINDADYTVTSLVNGKQIMCPFYKTWKHMLERCYSEKKHAKYQTYIGCSASSDWLTFSNFKKWMEKQTWQGMCLDKDLLVLGNKVYSDGTCVFVSQITNTFTVDRAARRGDWPIGVYFNKPAGMLMAQCSNPFTGKLETIGLFKCQNLAHQAWRKRKHEHALKLAELQTDQRVSNALRNRYA